MGKPTSFRQLVAVTCRRIIWQFVLGLCFVYLLPLSSISVQVLQNDAPMGSAGGWSIFFNVTSWVYICFLLVGLISYHMGKLLHLIAREMDTLYQKSMWLEGDQVENLSVEEFRETGQRLLKMQNRIQQLLAAEKAQKEELMFQVSAASHDLKTPLTIIKGNTEFLLATDKDRDSRESLEDIYKASQRLDAYFDQLIHYSKTFYQADEGWQEYAFQELAELVEREVQFLAKGKAELDFQTNGDQQVSYTLQLDFVLRAVQNMMTNALTYANSERARVCVRVEDKEGGLQLSVWNNGTPFSEEVMREFDRLFYREDKARSSHQEHYGIGLAFVARVARLHGGRVELHNVSDGAEVVMICERNRKVRR